MSTQKTAVPSWKKQSRAWHKVTPPSGMEGVEIRIPSLTELIREDAVPERLRALALKSAAHPAGLRGVMADELQSAKEAVTNEENPDGKLAEDNSELRKAIDDVVEMQKRLIVKSVKVGGEFLTEEDLDDAEFPAPDAEWFGSVMLREVDYDAQGVRLGVEPLDSWARFRDFHDCSADCSACQALQDEFSSVDLGGL